MKAIAVDDEPLALELIETYSANFDYLQLDKTFTKTSEALQYLEKTPVDLLFLDINMPAMSGMDFYRALTNKPMLVFTTSYSEYAIESYELNAVDYLLKPFTQLRFEKAITKAKEKYNLLRPAASPETETFIMLKADYGMIKIVLSKILFIQGLDNYLKIHLQNQAPVVIRITLKSMMEKLSEKEFIRVHRSYIVPVHRIELVKQRNIVVAGTEIPVGKNFEDNVRNLFEA